MNISEINDLLSNWKITGSITDLSSLGLSGAGIFRVDTLTHKLILKSYRQRFTPEIIQGINDVWNTLIKHDFKLVPQAQTTQKNMSYLQYNNQLWVLMTYLEGKNLSGEISNPQLESLVQSISRFHNILVNERPSVNLRIANTTNPQNVVNDINWWESLDNVSIDRFEKLGMKELADDFLGKSISVYSPIIDVDWVLLESKLPKSVIHRDINSRNILFVGDSVSGILDFEIMHYGVRLHDIARVLTEFTFCSEQDINLVISNYNKHNHLTDKEITELRRWIVLLNCGLGFWTLKRINSGNEDPEFINQMKQRLVRAIKVYDNLI